MTMSEMARRADNTVILRGIVVDLDSPVGEQYIRDFCRFVEGLITDRDFSIKYDLDPKTWGENKKNPAQARAVQAELNHRERSGTAAQEAAAKYHKDAVHRLGKMTQNEYTNDRTAIAATQELRQTAQPPGRPAGGVSGEKIHIKIDLSGNGETHITEYIYDQDTSISRITTNDGVKEETHANPDKDGANRSDIDVDW